VPASAVQKAFTEANIFVSPELLNEYREAPLALESEGKIDHLQLRSLISGIAAFVTAATLVHPQQKLHICRDPMDDIVLECCRAAKADVLVTGDKDLFEIADFPFDVHILSPRTFLKT
jgi:putative PIN family toxin of toxin-antitoxin system